MWLFTTHGFYSVKYDAAAPGTVHIRARSRQDLENLRSMVAELPTPETSYPGSDYPWRLLCPRARFQEILTTLGKDLTYDNFKAAALARPDQRDKSPTYHAIWAEMRRWQDAHNSNEA